MGAPVGVAGGAQRQGEPWPSWTLSLLIVIFLNLFFLIAGGQSLAQRRAAPKPGRGARLRRGPLCTPCVCGRAAGRSPRGGRGVNALFILTYWEGRHKSAAETKRVCRGGPGRTVSPDQLPFPAVAGGCSIARVCLH